MGHKKINHTFVLNKITVIINSYSPDIEKKIRKLNTYRHTEYGLIISAIIIGFIVGFFILVFHGVMILFENFFHAIFQTTKYSWHILLIPLIPCTGGLIVGFLNEYLYPGVPQSSLDEVAHSFHNKKGYLSWKNSLKAIINCAVSISSGGGAGREGPTVILGASLSSAFGQILKLRSSQVRILVGAGSAAAISGIFNAPLGGILFSIEAIIGELNIQSFIPIVISSVLSTAIVRSAAGNTPLFLSPAVVLLRWSDYFFLAAAGIMSAGVARYYLCAYFWSFEKIRDRVKDIKPIYRPAIGGFAAGILLMFLPAMLETTYSPINDAIAGKGFFWVALATVILKPFSNAATLGTNGAGGTMAPVIKTGAMFGFCFGIILKYFLPQTSVGLYAMVCAAATLSGTYSMPLTGAITLFEISQNYTLLLPLLFSSVFTTFVLNLMKIKTFNPIYKERKTDEDNEYVQIIN